jgi:hypothetical protein
MAGAEYADRSPGREIGLGALHVSPRSSEYENIVRSLFWPSAPSVHASTISFVASAPVGAPFAMSMLGIAARSARAPVIPSSTHRNETGSTKKQGLVIGRTSRGCVQVRPPSSDLMSVCAPCRPVPAKCVKNAYTTPSLSVRTVQPSSEPCWEFVNGGATGRAVQVMPPSVDVATDGKSGNAFPRLKL